MNKTVDELCALVGAGPCQEAGEQGLRQELLFVPACFELPEAAPVRLQPASGTAVAAGVSLYSDRRGGYLQVLQQPLALGTNAGPGLGYGLVAQVAEFDGTWLSLAFDARSLVAQSRPGKALLMLSAQVQTTPAMTAKLRCDWTVSGEKRQRDFELPADADMSFDLDLGPWVPAEVSQFAFHVIFAPEVRSTMSLRRLSAVLLIDEATESALAASSDSDGIFEVAP
ncbi:hypothetical protein LRH25_00710 [Ideonella azotifigens]|uniref:Uncharacterized protein n=2 Tax=Ideonella azotifigens TaxID=513160 RepID=A0ABN1KAG9_9BURK|nr:hypothetical protein [Ideonella azotifigens]MCD2338858.1 hypothetical protein [Ideonella azotifigens]